MSEIKFRLAKPSDAMQIAEVHYHVRDEYGEGFFAHVNKDFLKQYYKIIGFSSGSLDVSQEFKGFRKHKWRFVWPLFMTALRRPSIVKDALDRFRSTSPNSDKKFVNGQGARNEFWAWLPGRDDSYMSIYTQELMLYMMKILGVKKVYGEMDTVNEKIVRFQTRNGNKILDTYKMPDGRERMSVVMDLAEHKFKLPE